MSLSPPGGEHARILKKHGDFVLRKYKIVVFFYSLYPSYRREAHTPPLRKETDVFLRAERKAERTAARSIILVSHKMLQKISEAELRQARQRTQSILCVWSSPITQHDTNLAGKI